jgi:hypothetical protein
VFGEYFGAESDECAEDGHWRCGSGEVICFSCGCLSVIYLYFNWVLSPVGDRRNHPGGPGPVR